ncbi:MAG: D-tyrosyl-tRNA(Tyr) deacylase [Syntrophomonadaceae bacterium]|nr:D-tyrosyl-tRNA(Tyr) deacylase [Syntrophomonadaceae bacterium]
MRAVVQRSLASSVKVDGREIGQINGGLVVLLGICQGDTQNEANYIMEKIINLRIFPDEEGKMNRSLVEAGGQILLISQFTLYGDARKGRRPSFIEAELPEKALPLFNYCIEYIKTQGIEVATGEFGADMLVNIQNDGPVTILLDSDKVF